MANNTGLKFGGRTKGTLNKTTAETKEILKNIIDEELDKLSALMATLDPKEKIDVIVKILPYVIPRQSEIAIPIEDRPPAKIMIKINRYADE